MPQAKPIIIAHRSLLYGPDKTKENTLEQIVYTLTNTPFDIEIDVWFDNQTLQFYLGHDEPQIRVPAPQLDFLNNPRFWIHAKNNEALFELISQLPPHIHIFSHDQDDATLTSTRIPWVYPGKPISSTTPRCPAVIVMPERTPDAYTIEQLKRAHAICTDWPYRYQELTSS
jgi:hypothetical protein